MKKLRKNSDDVVFTVDYSVRAAQMAVYEFLSIDRQIPPISPHDKSLEVQFKALVKALKWVLPKQHNPKKSYAYRNEIRMKWLSSLGINAFYRIR